MIVHKKKKINHLFLACILFYFLFFIDYIIKGGGFLADDNIFRFEKDFTIIFDDPNIHSRPFNAITKYLINLFYFNKHILIFVFIICNTLTFYLFYKTIYEIWGSKHLALFSFLFSLLYIYSGATIFSPTMIISTFVVILLFTSILLIKKNKPSLYFLAGFLLFISTLSYEIAVFLFPVIALLFIKEINFKNILLRVFSIVIMPISLMYLYKKIIIKLLYPNYVVYTDKKFLISFNNFINAIISIIKTYLVDTFFVINKGLLGVKYFGVLDYLLLIVLLITVLLILKSKNQITPITFNKKEFFIIFIIFLASNGVIFISTYKSIIYGYENRILGITRFAFGLLIAYLFISFLNKNKFIKYIVPIFILINGIVLISEKNAWVFAEKFNMSIMKKLKTHIPKKPLSSTILVSYDKNLYQNKFILDEPTLKSNFEFLHYEKFLNFSSKFNYIFVNKKDYALDNFLGKSYNKREKTKLVFEDDILVTHYNKENFYFFDFESNSFFYVKNKKEYEKIIKKLCAE